MTFISVVGHMPLEDRIDPPRGSKNLATAGQRSERIGLCRGVHTALLLFVADSSLVSSFWDLTLSGIRMIQRVEEIERQLRVAEDELSYVQKVTPDSAMALIMPAIASP